MRLLRNTLSSALLILPLLAIGAGIATADDAEKVTTIHLEEFKGYFEVSETLMNLEPGDYVFEVKNSAGKVVGFMVQDLKTNEVLTMGPIEKGKTKEYKISISENGFRFRCPINPTPWYEVNVGAM